MERLSSWSVSKSVAQTYEEKTGFFVRMYTIEMDIIGTVSACFKPQLTFVFLHKGGINMQSQKLNSLQLELLKVYSFEPSEEDLLAIKDFLAKHFSDKLLKNVQYAIKEKNMTEDDLDSWVNA